jgi:hypothetical protein
MTPLTAEQIAAARAITGDTLAPYTVTDAQMQTIYADPDAANGDLARLYVHILRRRLGDAANLVNVSGDGASTAYQARFDHLRALVAYWERAAGMDGGALSSGRVALQIDAREA